MLRTQHESSVAKMYILPWESESMDIQPECVPCLMTRVLFQARLVDNGCEFRALSSALKTYSKEFGEGRNSAEVATAIHKTAYREMGVSDPYRELKIRSDEVASEFVERARSSVRESKDGFKTAVLWSIIGNVMDFGSGIAIDHPDEFRKKIDALLAQGISYDDTEEMKNAIKQSKTVIYIFDNCGEVQFDKILIDEIRKMGVRVVGVVRGEPILNDVSAIDVERVGIEKHLDCVLTTSQFAIGLDLQKIGTELKNEITGAGLIIAKGMANFESLSDQTVDVPVTYMLRSKCVPVANALGVETEKNVVRFRRK